MEYIDLGLPSGTLWADTNVKGFYTFDEAVENYGYRLPTREQLEELKSKCKWEFMCNGYKVTGPNGNTIVLPAEGRRNYYDDASFMGSYGFYWSTTLYCLDDAWYLGFDSSSVEIYDDDRYYRMSVRLVKNKDNKWTFI